DHLNEVVSRNSKNGAAPGPRSSAGSTSADMKISIAEEEQLLQQDQQAVEEVRKVYTYCGKKIDTQMTTVRAEQDLALMET
ncbi:unnamed protein product, partial [Amoebophrya sp. A120]